jgi:hypothetical protein
MCREMARLHTPIDWLAMGPCNQMEGDTRPGGRCASREREEDRECVKGSERSETRNGGG